ncbi:MAG: hypothetical protein WBE86_07160 [Candidatus Acidiferrales bacterium]
MSTFQRLIDSQPQAPDLLAGRVEAIRRIEAKTGRLLIIYAADWLTAIKQRTEGFAGHVSLDHNDILPFHELISPLNSSSIDVILHSPGGLAEAAERIVKMLRGRFASVRFFVPHSAMSAATMLCLSGDEIGMSETSALGPIDPQVNGIPARAIKKGFDRVRKAVGKTPGALTPYLPMLQKYDLHTFEICNNAEKLSKKLAAEWLNTYMFHGDHAASAKIAKIVRFFASHDNHHSHSRAVGVDECIRKGLKVCDLRRDPDLAELVWDLWQQVEYFFGFVSASAKLFENSHGVTFMRMLPQQAIFQMGMPLPLPPMVPPPH